MKNKKLRKKLMRKKERQQQEMLNQAAELKEAHLGMIPEEMRPREPETISRTQQKKIDRDQQQTRQREVKKAEHKLSWMDRLWGTGKGPIKLRMKWLDKLMGNE